MIQAALRSASFPGSQKAKAVMGGFSRSRLSNRANVPEDKMTDFCTRASAAETAPLLTKSIFPADAHALIYRAAPSVTMSARKRRSSWKLQFDRHLPLRI